MKRPSYYVTDTAIEMGLENLRLDRPYVQVSVGNLLNSLKDARTELRYLYFLINDAERAVCDGEGCLLYVSAPFEVLDAAGQGA